MIEDIRSEIKKYRHTKAEIEKLAVKIESLKLDMIPSPIQVITGMPFGGGNNESKVLKTVLDIDEDEDINDLKLKKYRLELKLRAVDAELIRLDNEERDYIGYYTKGVTQEELSKKYFIEVESVQKRIQRILDKVEGNFKRIA